MVLTVNQLDLVLGEILSKTNETAIKDVIGTYDHTKSLKENIHQVHIGFQKVTLMETSSFFKTISSEYPVPSNILNPKSRNKDEFARDIIKFLEFLKPTQCLVCNTGYVPSAEDYNENTPKCFLCSRPSHSTCYLDHHIDSEIGVIFLCSECLSVKAANELTENLQNAQVKHIIEKPPPEQKQGNSDAVNDHPEVNDHHVEIDNINIKDCPLYEKRICPHGLTGKREIDGKPCPFNHRKLCMYYSKYGPSGCRFKDKCRYFHPKMCQNSLKMKVCLDDTCSAIHIPGTQRIDKSKVVTHEPIQHIMPNTIQPWSENKPYSEKSVVTQPNSQNFNDNSNFLERYLEEMKTDLKAFTKTMIHQSIMGLQPQLMMIQQHNQIKQSSPQNHQRVQIENVNAVQPCSNPQLVQQLPENTQLPAPLYHNNTYNNQFPPLPNQHQQQVPPYLTSQFLLPSNLT